MKEKLRQWFSANFNASKAEKYNGWFAMIGIISGIGAYAITGQIIPGFSRFIKCLGKEAVVIILSH